MEDTPEKEELKDAIQQVDSDVEGLTLALHFIWEDVEIINANVDIEKLKKGVEDLRVWISSLEDSVDNLEEEIGRYIKKMMMKNL